MLRDSALKIIRALQIEGGCNVQFALASCINQLLIYSFFSTIADAIHTPYPV